MSFASLIIGISVITVIIGIILKAVIAVVAIGHNARFVAGNREIFVEPFHFKPA